jgi:hypothetical protein
METIHIQSDSLFIFLNLSRSEHNRHSQHIVCFAPSLRQQHLSISQLNVQVTCLLIVALQR